MGLESITLLKKDFAKPPDFDRILEDIYNVVSGLRDKLPSNTYLIENKAGDISIIRPADILKLAIPNIEFVVAQRGEHRDYITLALLEKKIGGYLEGQKQLEKYQSAFKNATKANYAPGDRNGWSYYSSGMIKSKWASYENNLTSPKRILIYREAISDLETGIKIQLKQENPPDDMHLDFSELALAWLELAYHLDTEEKIKALKKSVKHYQKAIFRKEDARYYYNLALALENLLILAPLNPFFLTPAKKETLKEKTIATYRKSYELNENPRTLRRIKEVEMFQI